MESKRSLANCEDIAQELYKIIAPYYRRVTPTVEFRRALTGEEVTSVLTSIHSLITEILEKESV
jgi:hypothetical protein